MKVIKTPQSTSQAGKFFKEANQLLGHQYTFFPRSITLTDLDQGIDSWFKSKDLSLDGIDTPVFFLTIDKWSEFKKRWQYMLFDRVIEPPFVTIRRTNTSLPQNQTRSRILGKKFNSYKVPIYENAGVTYKFYRVPQPIRVDLEYEVRALTNYQSDANRINEELLKHFSYINSYLNLDGHFIPMKIESMSDESTTSPDEQKLMHTLFSIKMEGYVIDEREFEELTGIAKILVQLKEYSE